MPMTQEQEKIVLELTTGMARFLIQGINRQPDVKTVEIIVKIQEAFNAQNSVDPRRDIKAWFKPLRNLVDYLDDALEERERREAIVERVRAAFGSRPDLPPGEVYVEQMKELWAGLLKKRDE